MWALYALAADIYLWLGEYDEAIGMCENIEKSGLYTLLSTDDWYGLYYPGNSSESIIELQWDGMQLQNNSLFAWFYNESANANNYAVSDAAVAKFNEFPDESDQRGDGGSYIESSGKIWKYAGTARGVSNLRESGRRDANWIFYRLADVLLMRAEALVMREGEGDMAAAYAIVRQIRERALQDSVHLLGHVHDVRMILGSSDAFLFPSKREGLGMAALEALSMGIPVIAADNRGTREYMQDGENGFVCEPEVLPVQMAQGILRLQRMRLLEKERLRQRCMLSVRMYEKRYPRRIMQEIYTRMDAQVYGS